MMNVALELAHWLARHNLPTEGVVLRVELPRRNHVYGAERALKAEMAPEMVAVTGLRWGKTTIAGIEIEFVASKGEG